jgi:hypothetical protein
MALATRRTTRCTVHGHAEFVLRYDPQLTLDGDVEWLTSYLEQSVAKGTTYLPSQTVQIGWMICRVFSRDDGTLGLEEPDFRSVPIGFADGVSLTTRHLRSQKDVCESVGLGGSLDFPVLRDSAIVCNCWGKSAALILARTSPKSGDSGWFFGCASEQHDHNTPQNLERISLYEAVVTRYAIVEYLALPSGSDVLLEQGSAPCLRKDGKPLSFVHGSYLEAKYKR